MFSSLLTNNLLFQSQVSLESNQKKWLGLFVLYWTLGLLITSKLYLLYFFF